MMFPGQIKHFSLCIFIWNKLYAFYFPKIKTVPLKLFYFKGKDYVFN